MAPAGSNVTPPARRGAARLLVATGISAYGDWLSTVALVVILFQRTGSTAAPAGYMLLRVTPRLLGATPGGALSDRWGPAHTAASAMLVQGGLVGLLAGTAGTVSIWTVYLLVAIAQFLGAMTRPAMTALTRMVSSDQTLARTNGLVGTVMASSMFVAPAIGAPLLAIRGPNVLLALDACSFVVAASLLLSLRHAVDESAVLEAPGSGAGRGMRFVFGHPTLRLLATAYVAGGAVVTALQAVLVVIAAERLGGTTAVAPCYAAVGAGGLLGSVSALRWGRNGGAMAPMVVLIAVELEVAPLAGLVLAHTLLSAMALLATSSVAATVYEVRGNVLIHQVAPPSQLGRIAAAMATLNFLGMGAGAACALVLAPTLGWPVLLVSLSAVAGGTVFVVWIATERRDRTPPPR